MTPRRCSATPTNPVTPRTPIEGSGAVDDGLPAAGGLDQASASAARTLKVTISFSGAAGGVRSTSPRRTWSWRTTQPSGRSTPASRQASHRLAAGRVHQSD